MNISYTDLPSWAQWIVVLVILIGAVLTILGFVKKVWPMIKKVVAIVALTEKLLDMNRVIEDLPRFMSSTAQTLQAQDTQMETTIATLTSQGTTLGVIKHEVLPNGGGSMRDDIVEIKKKLADVTDEVHELEQTRPNPNTKGTPS